MRSIARMCLGFALAANAVNAAAATIEVGPANDLRAAISSLQPGDELVLRSGTYELSSRFAISAVGTASAPILIRSQESALIRMNTGNQNVMEVQGSRHLVLRGLRFTGGSHGIRLMSSSDITIEDCEIFETGDVAISANSGGTYERLTIRRNHIHHTNGTGEGMYLGCNNNDCRVLNSVIENNYIHHTNRPSVEQGDGIELKEGSAGNVIRNNVIHDTNYPGILTYSTVGNGTPNVIEGNLIWNTNDYGIQSAADAIIRNNILLGSSLGMQRHQAGTPSNLQVVHNTIIGTGTGIAARDVTGTVVIANNAVYSRDSTAIRLISGDLSRVQAIGNVGFGGLSGKSGGFTNGNPANDFAGANYGGAPPIDVYPAAAGALVGAAAADHVPQVDFNGMPRNGARDVGAYGFAAGGNPGWTLAPGFKREAAAKTPRSPTNLIVN